MSDFDNFILDNADYLASVTPSYQPFILKELTLKNKIHCHIVSSDIVLEQLKELMKVIAPQITVLSFPEWDTVPYDRVSVKSDIEGVRIDTLCQLATKTYQEPLLILTTPFALLQKVPPITYFQNASLSIKEGDTLSFEALRDFLSQNSYLNVNTVMQTGEYAIRGGIIDVFPAGFLHPVRIDFFGDEIDSIKSFDETTQLSLKTQQQIVIKPIAEFDLSDKSVSLFRTKYRTHFETKSDDYFYQSVTNKIKVAGLEHFLPLFHQELACVLDYIPNASLSYDIKILQRIQTRLEQINEYYDARKSALNDLTMTQEVYQPVPVEEMFLSLDNLKDILAIRKLTVFSPFKEPDKQNAPVVAGKDFIAERKKDRDSVFEEVALYVKEKQKPVIFSASSFGSAGRLSSLLRDNGLNIVSIEKFDEWLKHKYSILIAPFETGFETDDFLLITETDILGEKLQRRVKKNKNSNFINDINALNIDDLLVHQTHGIGRFVGLVQLEISGFIHDCISLVYDGGDKLFVPVENMDVLSKYGSQNVALDHLGSQSFLNRKEKVKKDLFAMAQKLMDIAGARALEKQEKILAPHGLYQEFCARFPYVETEDQLRTIQEIESDLASGKPMDRLVCGDVGFGKTEIALRSAFLTALAGKQVAVVVPTTLLALQHKTTFENRFKGFPVRVFGLSRLTTPSKAKLIYDEIEKGTADIVIGTHALLSQKVKFKNLGLVVVDEEQHFGVTHKERLKELQKGVHVLTLTATPIPRTLQLSLSGVRSLSVIATPPVDRLAVKTFVSPFDPVIIKEAILREHYRGGQTFFVCPRISDMAQIREILSKIVPDIKVVSAHGQMPASQLENIMTAFSEKKYDILLATSIIESGLDLPSVNTIIVYRADMFGLSALYQMRGRVGRGKLRAYAYLTTPPLRTLGATAEKRLNVMQSLDSLGAGFTLASHDLDIRGAGNLLGDEQSGHIKEVGIALYQKMLSETIQRLKAVKSGEQVQETDFSPQISIGFPVFIPSSYITDLDVRMDLYHRIGNLENMQEVEAFQIEIQDRFGAYPQEVENLFITVRLKILAKQAHIERIDAGPKGANISFYQNTFPNPAKLIEYISSQMGTIRIRPDQKLVVMRPWTQLEDRLKGVEKIISKIAQLAQ